MQFEFWWLLAIPLLFGAGWLAARLEGRETIKQSKQLPEAYFTGLNFLLNEQSDKAIDAFTQVVQYDPETIELHFALGNLFRRRGETERAIRVHQNLVSRTDLRNDQRQRALFELGQDYLRAGLLDRAEDQLNRLEGGEYAVAALQHRLTIAQQLREWDKATKFAQQLADQPGANKAAYQSKIAHFYCERALVAAPAQALTFLDQAQQVAPSSPRLRIVKAQTFAKLEQWDSARAELDALARDNPQHLSLATAVHAQVHEHARSADAGLAQLRQVYEKTQSVDLLAGISSQLEQGQGTQASLSFMREALSKAPSLLGLGQLFRLGERAGESFRDLELAKTLVSSRATKLGRYTCSHCGFRAQQYYWQCPGCHEWDSTEPRRTEELDLYTE